MPYYGPDEPAETIFLERTFIAGDFLSGLGYGVQLVLFTSCALFLWEQRKTRRQAVYLLVYITLLLLVETLFEAVQARTVQVIYIDNRNYPGGPWQYFLDTQYLAINVIFYATLFVLTFLSDLLVLWRCWVIWNASGKTVAYLVTFFPALVLLASFVMGTLWTLQSSQPGLSLYSSLPLAYGLSYYILSLSVNILLTILITIRLIMYRRALMSTLPTDHAKNYISLATIVVESAAIYSAFALMFIITYAINNPMNQIFLTLAGSAQQIAGYLIIYRLAQGRAWNKEALTKQISTMNFDSPQNHTNTTRHTMLDSSMVETPSSGATFTLKSRVLQGDSFE
ncbi:hypothetical protein BD779DRAFT_82945 [Infundibulicybe gibba]|nr:hypothetical protein BD779DRAFT_82945 [Infundibulicybe gibba]